MQLRDGSAAAGPVQLQTCFFDLINMLCPAVHGPDLMSGICQQRRIDRSHCPGADNCNLHDFPFLCVCIVNAAFQHQCRFCTAEVKSLPLPHQPQTA